MKGCKGRLEASSIHVSDNFAFACIWSGKFYFYQIREESQNFEKRYLPWLHFDTVLLLPHYFF